MSAPQGNVLLECEHCQRFSRAAETVLNRLQELVARLNGGNNGRPPTAVAPPMADEPRKFLTTKEAAALLGKAEFTTREYCRLQRIRAVRARSGRGSTPEWRIPVEEIARVLNEGLLPPMSQRGRRNPPRNGD